MNIIYILSLIGCIINICLGIKLFRLFKKPTPRVFFVIFIGAFIVVTINVINNMLRHSGFVLTNW